MPETNRIEYKQMLTGDFSVVEQLDSDVPCVLDVYSKDCFTFSDNFLRMAFPSPEMDYSGDNPQITPYDIPHVDQLIIALEGEMHRDEILDKLGLADRKNLRENYLNPAFETGLIEYTLPETPKSKHQKYRLTEKGKAYKKTL
jgi:hypothetical protein